MNKFINIHEAKTHLSRLVEQAAAGEEVIIAKAGRPMARLVPMNPVSHTKKLGMLRGKVKVPENFNTPLPEDIQRLFEGR